MKKVLMGVALLVAACGLMAQEGSAGRMNAAAGFSETSAAQVQFVSVSTDSAAPANAAAKLHQVLRRRLLRQQIQFRLLATFSAIATTIVGNSVSASSMFAFSRTHLIPTCWDWHHADDYTNDWFGVEGDVVTVFSPDTVSANNHGKLFGGAGGFRIGGRRARWEPWAHALVGGTHLQPQTAYGSRNAIMAIAGVGVDYRVHARLSFRGEGDYVYTGYFSQSQSNFQFIGGVVLHF
jgi:hypothetical protein